ncbi:hypothetical protein GCK72_025765 [Caenorhabditis remanei]|nr:hypothetical protein GCK72_025765 [Caenorhabditis remanei]KAF1749298.1 hypothetical protein GCK72_025765 [Caenorhabditis remanei]
MTQPPPNSPVPVKKSSLHQSIYQFEEQYSRLVDFITNSSLADHTCILIDDEYNMEEEMRDYDCDDLLDSTCFVNL